MEFIDMIKEVAMVKQEINVLPYGNLPGGETVVKTRPYLETIFMHFSPCLYFSIGFSAA